MEPAKFVWGDDEYATQAECEDAIAKSLADQLTEAQLGLVGMSDTLTNNTAPLYAIEIKVSLVKAQ